MHRKPVRHRDDAQIDVTPMLDVVFIMLIFFLVTTSFSRTTGIDLSGASSDSAQVVDEKDMIAVRIDASDAVFVNGRQHDIRAVRAAIQTALAADPAAPVVLIVHRQAGTGIVVQAVDQARRAGAQQVSLAASDRAGR